MVQASVLEDSKAAHGVELPIGGDQRQVEDLGSGDQEAIGRIAMLAREGSTRQSDFAARCACRAARFTRARSRTTRLLQGQMRSSSIRPRPRIAPSQDDPRDETRAGTTSARGLPKRVTRRGRPVARTRSSAAKQVALNFETAISSTARSCHGQ